MTGPYTKIVSAASVALFAAAGIFCLGTCGSEDKRVAAASHSVPLGGACGNLDECQLVAGKLVECRCTDQSAKPLCVADLEAGENCNTVGLFSPVCRPGTRCTPQDLNLANLACLPIAQAGQSCGSSTGGCADPYYCDSSQHCALGQSELGQSCSEHAECKAPNICPWGKFLCSAPAKIGEACSTNSEGRSECAAGAGCDGSKCVAHKADGQDCVFDEECTSGLCSIAGTCGTGTGQAAMGCGLF